MIDALLRWYGREARDLPWRRTRDPWAILVSEVMLQQTQASRVVPYYERFLQRFPDPSSCAGAPAAEVLRSWSGLGYNRRALALHRAAAVIAAHGWPQDLEDLPGVGSYTAAAVASFAFGAPGLAVDTNVRRVLARTGLRVGAPTPALNQALMELGATVCTARGPRCAACPLAEDCDGPEELETTIVELEEEMAAASDELRFEYAARLRDEIRELSRDLRQLREHGAPAS